MFAGYHSGRSAAGKGGFIASLVETTLWLLKLYGQKTESVVMILLLRICFKNYKILIDQVVFMWKRNTFKAIFQTVFD
jgi:hypothetical protein